MFKKILFLGCIISLFSSLYAQTTLSAGDVAIIGVNYGSSPNYELTIVTLAPIAANTQIRISDYWYNESTPNQLTNISAGSGAALTSEGTVLWQPTAAIPAGNVYKISILQGGNTVTGLPGNVSITGWSTAAGTPSSAGGDNWFIYQGTSTTNVSNFVFLWGNASNPVINGTTIVPGQFVTPGSFNNTWGTTNLGNNNVTYLPPSLNLGTNAIALTVDPSLNAGIGFHADNNIYTGIKSGTKAALLASICNTNNWNRNDTTPFDITPGGSNFTGSNPIFTVTATCTLTLTAASQTNVSCFGSTNGAASVNTATGGSGNYSYNWTPGNPTGDGTISVTGLSAGTWTCTVTDNITGCSTIRDFTITQPTALSLTLNSQTNISCNGGSNGTATVNSATGGAGGFTYNWTPGNPTGDGTTSVSGLSLGTWICTVTDANGCTATRNFVVTQPSAIVLTAASQTNISCNGGSNGAATVNSATGGAGGFTYNWTPGNPTGDGTTSVSGLSVGIWICTVTDANGCSATRNFVVTQPASAVSGTTTVTNVACNGGTNGAINLTPSGGTAPYTFSWTGGITTEDRTGLAAGSYSVTITDSNGCSGVVNVSVTQPASIDNTVTQTAGILEAVQTGATYQWYQCPNTILTGKTNQTFTPTVVGDYKVEISLGGCFNTSTCVTVTILENNSFDATNFVFYPNPTSDILYITNGNLIDEVEVSNMLGQQIISTKFKSNEVELRLTILPAATYFIKVKSEGKSKIIKVLKK